MKKRRQAETRRLIIVFCTLFLFVALSAVWLFVSLKTTNKLSDDYISFYRGNTYSYPSGSNIEKTNDNIVLINKEYNGGLPLMGNHNVIVTGDMIYDAVSTRRLGKVDASTIISNENGKILFTDSFQNDRQVEGENGFLYDGVNTFILLQDTILEFNDTSVNLSKLSCVIYESDMVTYYDFASRSGVSRELIKNTVSITCDSYRIDADTAVVTYPGGVTVLLFTNPGVIKSVFE